jgi:hypothetical protein
MANVYLYQLDSGYNTVAVAFTFKFVSAKLQTKKAADDLSIPGQLLVLQKWDSKTQTRVWSLKGSIVASTAAHSAGNGEGSLILQVQDLVGDLYTVTPGVIGPKIEPTEERSTIGWTIGINKAAKYGLEIPFPDGSKFYAVGTVTNFTLTYDEGATNDLGISLDFEESRDVIGLGGE